MIYQNQTELFSSLVRVEDSQEVSSLRQWFDDAVGEPTEVQQQAWPCIQSGHNALLLSSTGQGKSLAAWLPLVEHYLLQNQPSDRLFALHIAPLKALASDMTHNLKALMHAASACAGRPVRMEVRSGDSSAYERDRQIRSSPQFLATTPETLFILLGSARGRRWLQNVQAVVVDEIHALAISKRGAHLVLSLERLEQLTGRRLQRIGLSATARPHQRLADFLCGQRPCQIIATDSKITAKVQIESLAAPLGPFPHHGHWREVHDRIAEIALEIKNPNAGMLVFCSTRAQVEKTAFALSERLGVTQVGAHHGSLDRSHRETLENRFRHGQLKLIVSSASLELGLDLGQIERVCQLGSSGSTNQLCQRAGRSGHRPGAVPHVHVFPLTLNQWLEAEAAAEAIGLADIEDTEIIQAPLDVLAQHVIAMVSNPIEAELKASGLFEVVRQAYPWHDLTPEAFDQVIDFLSGHPVAGTGDAGPLLSVSESGHLRSEKIAARLALTNAGVIPEWFEYEVLNHADQQFLGRLDEEFAFESSVGDVVQLGNRPFQIVRTKPGTIWVEQYDGEAVQVPFWFGDGASRSPALSQRILQRFGQASTSTDIADWLARCKQVLGALPAPDQLIVERFFDPNQDRHLVIHSFAGARLNRAWGLALRKRFCRQFNFELQAAATDDGILISLGTGGQFEVEEIVRFVSSSNARSVLIQALLDTPLFITRFRWCANHALSVLRFDQSGPVSPPIQRNRTENLIEQVFPEQLACLENLSGPREVPDHPLVQQALADCLHEHMDIVGLEQLLNRIENGQTRVIAVDLEQPSPLAESLIHAPPHSFLDEAAAEERRTRSFESRPGSPFQKASARISPSRKLVQQSTAKTRTGIQYGTAGLLELLDSAGYLTRAEGESGRGMDGAQGCGGWSGPFQALMARREAFSLSLDARHGLWVSAQNLPLLRRLLPSAGLKPWMPDSLSAHSALSLPEALTVILRRRQSMLNTIDPEQASSELLIAPGRIADVLKTLSLSVDSAKQHLQYTIQSD